MEWMTIPIAALILFEVISTLAQIAGFGGLLLWQRSNFERRITALELTHTAQRQQDRAAAKHRTRELENQIRTLITVIREIKPDANISLTGAHDIVEAAEVKRLREFLRRHYSADEFGILLADFGVNSDEYQNETTISRMDKFLRAMARADRLDDVRDRFIADRPTAAADLGNDL